MNDYSIYRQILADICDNDKAKREYIFESVNPDYFPQGLARDCFESALRLFQNGEDVDPLTIAYGLPDNKILAAKRLLLESWQESVSTEGYRQHCECVIKEAFSRNLAEYSSELQELAFYNSGVDEIQAKLTEALTRFERKKKTISLDYIAGLQNFLDELSKPKEYFKTGFEAVDKVLKISRGDYIVIGARPSVGKTAFALQTAWNMANQDDMFVNIVFFSFETSTAKIYNRLIANQFNIDLNRIITNQVTELEKDSIENKIAEGDLISINVVEASGMTVADIQAEALKRKADVIFIDYLGLINAGETQQISSYERMTQISKDLHTFAQSKKITVIALSQLNRESEKENKPTLASLRDSGQVEQDADAVILLYKLKMKDEQQDNGQFRGLDIAKNKEGELGVAVLNFMGQYQRFIYVDPQHRPEFIN